MGRKTDILLGRGFKPHKFKALINLSLSRLAVLKNQRRVRCNQARSDVLQLLQQGHHDPALLRVENVIKEQKMLDVFVMLESYINVVVERVSLFEHHRVCPDELKEAVSGLVYAASRCGDFPELQELRTVFTSRFGKEFTASATELRNDCGVNPKLLQKLSTRQPDLDTKMKVLKEIASENNIVLQLEEASYDSIEESLEVSKPNQSEPGPSTNAASSKLVDYQPNFTEAIGNDDGFATDSMQTRRKYRDVADAAEAAFQSAAHAAEAARAALELSRSQPHDSDGPDSPNTRPRKVSSINKHMKVEIQHIKNESDLKRDISSSSSDSARDILAVPTMSFDGMDQAKLLEKDLIFDESDNEESYSFKSNNFPENESSHRNIPLRAESGLKVEAKSLGASEGTRMRNGQHLNVAKGPISVRTRQVRGY